MASNKYPAGDRRSLPTFASTFPRKPWSIETVFFARVEADFQRKDAVQGLPGVRHWFRCT